MSPQKFCRNCGRVLGAVEQFCSACGTKVEERNASTNIVSAESSERTCSLCGHRNPPDVRTCGSCGAALASSPGKKTGDERARRQPGAPKSIKAVRSKYLSGWKYLTLLAVALIAAIVYFRSQNTDATRTIVPPGHAQVSAREMDSLRGVVEQTPQDAQALVQLANLYYDTKMFPEAIQTYARYLQLQPSDADARVDLGVSYFNLSFADSLHHQEDIQRARDEMEKAITYQPKHQLAYFNLGIVTLHSGNIEQATEWFRKCIAVDTTSEAGRTAKQFLSQHQTTNRPTS